MNLLEYNDHVNSLDTRFELSPVLSQFVEQDINKDSLDEYMREIINFYAVALKDVYRLVAFFAETQGEIVECQSPTDIYTSPRKLQTMKSAFTFNDSSDSFTLQQLSELKGGLQKQSIKTNSGANFTYVGVNQSMWSKKPTAMEFSMPSSAQITTKDWPNLENAMDFLVNINSSLGSDNNSFTKDNNDSPQDDLGS